MPLFRLEFDLPRHGWMLLHFYAQEKHLAFDGSYIFDGPLNIIETLLRVAQHELPTRALWAAEPDQLIFNFDKAGKEVQLSISYEWIGDLTATVELAPIVGSKDEICLPFWRALRSLQARIEGTEYQWRDWGPEFPTRELALLTQHLGKG